MSKRKRRSVKSVLTKIRNFALLFIVAVCGFFWLNDNYLHYEVIPSSYEVIAALGLAPKPHIELEEGETSVSFIDVGQGDCTLIMAGGKSVLIDCGEEENANAVIGFLKFAGVDSLDLVIVTHPHSDHYGGMEKIIRRFETELVIMPETDEEIIYDTATYAKFMSTLDNRGIPHRCPTVGERIELSDDAFLELLAPIRSDYEDLNDLSVVTRFVHGENSFLFTGDLSFEGEYDLIDSGADLDVDILKVGHHGSASSTSEEFLHYVTPDTAVFEVGLHNTYGHPTREVMERLERAECYETYSTANNGNIVFVSDGVSLEKITEKNSPIYINDLFAFG